ncbi:hypothetical protein AD00_1102 [Escherichia coli 2-316-03_S4_C2]|nr:hypothetical protein AD00_1102 [Escherichia coli 2-316-03_S4_C2]
MCTQHSDYLAQNLMKKQSLCNDCVMMWIQKIYLISWR